MLNKISDSDFSDSIIKTVQHVKYHKLCNNMEAGSTHV